MFRFMMMATAMLIAVDSAVANGHESSSAPPPPKPEGPPARAVITRKGAMLVDLKGMTLYYFERDTSGNKSNCNSKCAEAWIPLPAPAGATASGDFTVITRDDGSKMWAYRYRPLYTFHADKAAGDVKGDDSAWHIVRPY